MKKIFLSAASLLLTCLAIAQTDTEPPVLVCKQQVAINMMPTCLSPLWAVDLVENISDDQTPPHLIELGARKECTGTGFPQGKTYIYLTTTELGMSTVELWAKDLTGNTSNCKVSVLLQEVFGSCDPSLNMTFKTAPGEGIDSITVPVQGVNCKQDSFGYELFVRKPDHWPASLTGHYDQLGGSIAPAVGYQTDISPKKNINPLNGVTSYDLTLLSRHILGIEPLDSPYKIIAADANLDGKITTFDIVLLRKLILGQIDQLPHGKSWRFIPADYVFPNPNNPFMPAFPEKITVPGTLDLLPNSFHFIGVKIGDLDFSADPRR